MKDLLPADFKELFTPDLLAKVISIFLIFVFGFLVVRFLSFVVGRVTRRRLSAQTVMLFRKGIHYSGAFVILLVVLQQMGLNLTALLGAAGVIGIAVGFASRTSMSNMISGLFLIWEKPFAVGDVIKIGDTVGVVLSVDLLSVKVRTFDNQFVRIPNERILTTELTNITRFPIRRMDINLSVAYKEDITKVMECLLEIALNNPYCLNEPAPIVVFTDFGESSLDFLFALWFEKSDYLNLKNSVMKEIKERFEKVGIEIPFPHRTLYTGSATDPFPIKIVDGEAGLQTGREGAGQAERK